MKQFVLLSALIAGIWYYRTPETAPASQTVVSEAFEKHRKLTSRLWLEASQRLKDGRLNDSRAAQEYIAAQSPLLRDKAFAGVLEEIKKLPNPPKNEDFAALLERLAIEGDASLRTQ